MVDVRHDTIHSTAQLSSLLKIGYIVSDKLHSLLFNIYSRTLILNDLLNIAHLFNSYLHFCLILIWNIGCQAWYKTLKANCGHQIVSLTKLSLFYMSHLKYSCLHICFKIKVSKKCASLCASLVFWWKAKWSIQE